MTSKPEETQEVKEEAQAPAVTIENRVEALEEVVNELIDKIEEVVKGYEALKKSGVGKPKGKFGGKRGRVPTKDLQTGVIYISKAAVGKEFAAEVGMSPADTFAWYTVEKTLKLKDGTSPRFVEAGEEEGAKAVAEYEAQLAKEVAKANAKLEAEAVEKAKPPAPAPVEKGKGK